MEYSALARDNREIQTVWFSGEDSTYFKVGEHGVTKIKSYDEFGSGNYEPWLAIYKGDFLFARVRAQGIEQVSYMDNSTRSIKTWQGTGPANETDIEDMEFSYRTEKRLKSLGIETVHDLTMKYPSDLLNIPGFGRTSLKEVKDVLSIHNLNLIE